MAASDSNTDDSLYPIAVLIDELKNEDVQVIVTTMIAANELPASPSPKLSFSRCYPLKGIPR